MPDLCPGTQFLISPQCFKFNELVIAVALAGGTHVQRTIRMDVVSVFNEQVAVEVIGKSIYGN